MQCTKREISLLLYICQYERFEGFYNPNKGVSYKFTWNSVGYIIDDADRFVIEQAAISSAPGKKKFYYFDHEINKNQNDIKAWYFMVASFDKGHLKKHFDKSLWPFIKDCIVETDTLSNILGKNNIYEFQLLHIDTEGHDLKVLQSMDFSVYMPALIYIEYKHLSDSDNLELLNLLENQGYTVYDCGIDYFAVHKKQYMRYL